MLRLGASLPTSAPTGSSLPNLLLDDYEGGVRGYSLRKLKKDYSGYILRLRRSSDDEEVDVAFDDDNEFSADSKLYNASGSTADGTLLSAWMGMSALYMTKWYDQSSAGLDIAQGTALLQPVLGAFGSFSTSNGKNTVYFNGSTVLPLTSTGLTYQSVSAYTVSENIDIDYAAYQWAWGLGADLTFGCLQEYVGLGIGWNRFYYAGSQTPTYASSLEVQQIRTFHGGAGDFVVMYQNNAAGTGTGTTVTGSMSDGASTFMGSYYADASLFNWLGNFQEFIVFDTDTSSDRAAITTNLNDYYGTY